MIDVGIHATQLNALSQRFTRSGDKAAANIYREVQRIAFDLVGYIKTQKLQGSPIGHRSGRLSNSITDDVRIEGGKITALVGVRRGLAPYAVHLEYGTRPHIIRARNARFLRFKGADGGAVFRRQVNHPGNREYAFLRGSLAEHRERIFQRLFAAAVTASQG